jgi:hypothetical protein
MSSLFFNFKSKFSQRYIAYIICFACNSQIPRAKRTKGWPITVCNSPKSHLSPFCNLSKGNGVLLTIWVKLVRNCIRYTIYFWAFPKRALLPVRDVAKENRCTLESHPKSKQTTFANLQPANWALFRSYFFFLYSTWSLPICTSIYNLTWESVWTRIRRQEKYVVRSP